MENVKIQKYRMQNTELKTFFLTTFLPKYFYSDFGVCEILIETRVSSFIIVKNGTVLHCFMFTYN